MSNEQDTVQDTLFLAEREAKVEDTFATAVGPMICTFVLRLLKVSKMFSVEHNQTTITAREFADWLEDAFQEFGEEQFLLQLTEASFFVNGQLIRMDSRTYGISMEIKSTFLGFSVNQIGFKKGISAAEILALAGTLRAAGIGGHLDIATFQQPHLELASVEEQELDVPEEEDPRRQLIETYAGLMIKCSVYFHRLRKESNPSAKHIKRLVQRIAGDIDEKGDIFVGLINLRIITGQDFVHSVNTAIYSMMLANAVRLDRMDVVRCGMTALTQDLDRIRKPELGEVQFEAGDDTHFATNLSSVSTLSQMGAADVLSALRLVTSYERGFPFNKPLPSVWYRDELRPHLLSRIVEIARHYDISTQGLEGVKPQKPDLALQSMMMMMGSHYDPNLMKLFVNVVGIFPVGCIVELSTRERAIVLRSPALINDQGLSDANRPIVRMMDGSARILDLAAQANQGIRIVRIVEDDEIDERPGAFFLF